MELLDYFNQFGPHTIYFVMFLVFLATGFGLPLPEDVPLIIAGYLCGISPGRAPYFWVMLPVCMASIVGSDTVLYWLGRRYGPRAKKLPVFGRLLKSRQVLRAETRIREHGGKFVFAARFLPGLRAPAFFVAGTSRVPFTRFLYYDGLAAALSVPAILGLAYVFANELDHVRKLVAEGQLLAVAGVVIAAGVFIFFQLRAGKKRQSKLRTALAHRILRRRHGRAPAIDLDTQAHEDALAEAQDEPAPRFGAVQDPASAPKPSGDDAEAA
ncbi:MAG: DedA family protein [Planctomycetota bacterium]